MKELQILQKGEYYGVADKEGNWIVEPIYDEISEFHHGYARIKKDDLYGLINEEGKIIVPVEYDEIEGQHNISFDYEKGTLEKFDYSYFVEGRIIVGKYDIINGEIVWQWGFVDEEGNPITPIHFDAVEPFKDGLAKVYKDRGYGLIDLNGNWVLRPTHENIGDFHLSEEYAKIDPLAYVVEIEDFKEDLAVVAVQRGWDKKYGYIRRDGSWFKEPIYDSAGHFQDGVARVELGHWGLIDKKGDWVVKSKFSRIEDFHEGLAVAADVCKKSDYFFFKYGYIDKKGKWVIPPKFCAAEPFHKGIAKVIETRDGEVKQIDKNGKYIP